MSMRWFLVALATTSAGLCAVAAAQSSYPYSQPNLRDDEQISPSQIVQPPPAPKATARPSQPSLAALPDAKSAGAAHVVTCGGAFTKNSGHLKLATLFGAQNVSFGEVTDDNGGAPLKATLLYAKDPKRRLEVLWEDEASHSGTPRMVIEGQSTWIGPKGLKLGMPLAALEKLNGKPFKLKGFGKNDLGQVTDWDGGALGTLPGDCGVGVDLKPDPKASADARAAVPPDKEFLSNEAVIKAVKPTIAEILVGYSDDAH